MRMKQVKQIGLRALILVLLLAVALCSVQREAIASQPGVSMRIHVADPKHGLADEDVLVDVYFVATVVNGQYQAEAPYGSGLLTWNSNEEQRNLTNTLINIALQRGTPIIEGAPCGTLINHKDDGSALVPGLYLLIVRGADLEEYTGTVKLDGKSYTVTLVENDEYHFQYLPSLVALLEDAGTVEISPKPDVIPKNPNPEPTPTPSESPEPSTSPEPSESPEPSVPPVPSPTPSESPEPSTSPEPSSSPEPGESPEPSVPPEPSGTPGPYVPPTPTRRPDPPPPDVLDPEEEEFEDIFDEDVPLGPLPQTGQLWWPVPVLGALGLILVGAGLYLMRKDRRKRESA